MRGADQGPTSTPGGRSAAKRSSIRSRLIDKVSSLEDPVLKASLQKAVDEADGSTRSHRDALHREIAEVADRLSPSSDVAEAIPLVREAAASCAKLDERRAKKRRQATSMILRFIAENTDEIDDASVAWTRDNLEALLGNKWLYTHLHNILIDPESAPFTRTLPVKSRRGKTAVLIRFDTDNRFVQDLVIETHAETRAIASVSRLCSSFSESLSGDLPSNLSELTAGRLAKQLAFFKGQRWIPGLVATIYAHALRKQGRVKSISARDGITLAFLENPKFVEFYDAGFRAVPLNPIDPVPTWDKWAVYPNGSEDDYAQGKPDKWVSTDFSEVDHALRDHLKKWFWTGDTALVNRKAELQYVKGFLRWRSDESARIITLGQSYLITSEEVEIYLLKERLRYSHDGFDGLKGAMRSLVEFLSEEGDDLVDPLCPHVIDEAGRGAKTDAEQKPSIPDEHYHILEEEFERQASGSTEGLLDYAAFLLIGLSPLRASSVFDLKTSHIVETSTGGLYAIRQPSKTTGRDVRSLQIHPKIKRVLDKAVVATSALRDRAPDDLRDYVFLAEGHRGSITTIPKDTFAKRLRRVCRSLGLPAYSPIALRCRYMEKARIGGDFLGMEPPATAAVTGHADERSDWTYIRPRLEGNKEYYEALYGVEIGTAKIRGNVTETLPSGLGEKDAVEGGAGFCKSEECSLEGALPCFLCRNFYATPDNLPALKAAVSEVDGRISMRDTDHDRGHLCALKTLLVAYICKLEDMKKPADGQAPDATNRPD